MNVPFLDLRSHHEAIRGELRAAIEEVTDACAFAGGPFVERFEREFAAFCGAQFASGVGNGTDALWLALIALGVGQGDEVITVSSTFLATAEAITYAGARPVFVDIESDTYTMDPALIERAITSRTRAILPVHLFGQMADMDPIAEIARKYDLFVIEDACQAHGAGYKGRKAGTIGHAGCFSFYPGKNLGALGEAGAVVTNCAEVKQAIDVLRDHGQATKYFHKVVGWNGRMDGIQAAALSIKLKRLADNNEKRRQHAALYYQLLSRVEDILLPVTALDRQHVFHLFAIRTPRRDDLMRHLSSKGIACGIHYPIPVHLQEAYQSLGYTRGAFPVAERCASEFVSLPMFPELTLEQIAYVAEQIQSWAKSPVTA